MQINQINQNNIQNTLIQNNWINFEFFKDVIGILSKVNVAIDINKVTIVELEIEYYTEEKSVKTYNIYLVGGLKIWIRYERNNINGQEYINYSIIPITCNT